jgi:lipopolysaccharide/colanic/teichoic acid biosynthesis glycosyltransferase
MRVEDRLYHETVDRYAVRHRVKPGITGWAQVNGCRGEIRDRALAERRVALDLFYIKNWSLGLDVQILARTVLCLFHDNNAY